MELPQKRCTTPRAPLTRPRAALTLRVSITCAPTFSSTAARLCAGRGKVSLLPVLCPHLLSRRSTRAGRNSKLKKEYVEGINVLPFLWSPPLRAHSSHD